MPVGRRETSWEAVALDQGREEGSLDWGIEQREVVRFRIYSEGLGKGVTGGLDEGYEEKRRHKNDS